MWMIDSNDQPNVMVAYGSDFFPERKEPGVLYLSASNPEDPLHVACQITPERFKLLQEFVEAGNRVVGYNAVQRPLAFAR